MAEPFLGEIKIFGCNYPPQYWTYCDGQILPIQQSPALFAVIGTIYGGDGRTTMGLPNLKGEAPMHWGQAPGLNYYDIGAHGGYNEVVLSTSNLPAHTHEVNLMSYPSATKTPDATQFMAGGAGGTKIYTKDADPLIPMASTALKSVGQNESHLNYQPSLSMNFCIALEGVFPPRN